MGKIRVRTLGDEGQENEQKNKSKKKAQEKKLVKGGKGGERVVSVGPSEEELAKLSVSEEPKDEKPATTETQKKQKHRKERIHSKSYQTTAKMVDRNKKYSLTDALELLEKLKRSHFDETVELHLNTIEQGISGSTVLPHGSGKELRVAIASDEILSDVQEGKINFDILLADPSMMPKLARVAKFLGPRGLMPNSKNGTLTKDPQKLAASFKKGQVNFKTEAKAPIMHLSVGKLSFGQKKLSENIEKIIDAIKKEKIQKAVLKSTMSPGIKISL